MPELPEVQTTVDGIRRRVIGRRIMGAWSGYDSPFHKGADNIKDPAFFRKFKKAVVGEKIISAERRAKNILINLEEGLTILIHMKMTGHVLYGTYRFDAKNAKDPWQAVSPPALKDPFNRHIRFVLSLDDGKRLALSDMRKFAKVTFLRTDLIHKSVHLNTIGPEPLEASFTFVKFQERLGKRPAGKVKQVIMDQGVMAGVGNIYADESLWRAGINPSERVRDIPDRKLHQLYKAIRKVLASGIELGGASTSDYRNIDGELGRSHEKHHAYQRTGERCDKKGCGGTIVRTVVGARGTHFCSRHQRLFTEQVRV